MIDEVDYVDLGLACAGVCRTLERGLKETRADEPNRPVLEAIKRLTTWVDATAICSVRGLLTYNRAIRLQDCGRDREVGRQAGQTQRNCPNFTHEEFG